MFTPELLSVSVNVKDMLTACYSKWCKTGKDNIKKLTDASVRRLTGAGTSSNQVQSFPRAHGVLPMQPRVDGAQKAGEDRRPSQVILGPPSRLGRT